MREIAEKWAFGMAPPKVHTQAERNRAAHVVLHYLESGEYSLDLLDALSVVKGLFNRVHRQDQWDWFTVSAQLGYPSARTCDVIGQHLSALRSALKHECTADASERLGVLQRLPTRRCLSVFLGKAKISVEPESGWIYLLSNREWPDLVKVGMTARTVEERVREINAATGVPIPFGVRGCWRVRSPAQAEKAVHMALSHCRVRGDREFFRVTYSGASAAIQTALQAERLDLWTLNSSAYTDASKKTAEASDPAG